MKYCIFLAAGWMLLTTTGMIFVPRGEYRPFVPPARGLPPVKTVPSFLLDQDLVTREKYLKFVVLHPEWRKSQVKAIFADAHYLASWTSDVGIKPAQRQQAVTEVSWFAANAYCESLDKELPTTDQWERALSDNTRESVKLNENILAWYGKPTAVEAPRIRASGKNGFGIYDLGFSIWEWTQDFSAFLTSTDARADSGKDTTLFCAGGSQMGNAADYATFMRFSFRSSLKANYTTSALGFRCAKEISQ